MKKRSLLHPVCLALILALIGFSGCREEGSLPGLVTPVEDDGTTLGRQADATGVDDVALHNALEAMWKNTDGVLMQVFTQTIDCRLGGEMRVQPTGWPDGYDVILEVDPGTLPLNHDPVVEFVLEVPVTGPADATSVPYEFHPDGIRFDRPIHITVAWPQWAGAAPASGMDLWYLEQEVHNGTEHYRVLDREAGEPVAPPAAAKALEVTLLRYSIDHFSRWSVGDNDPEPDDDGDGGIAELSRASLSATREGDCCWSDLELDPNRHIQVDF